jgi:Sulfotransferase family
LVLEPSDGSGFRAQKSRNCHGCANREAGDFMSEQGPDFLVIGAQRAGTTWLHRVLSQHPQLWLPPVKELHYFDKLETKRTAFDPKERRRVRLSGLKSMDPWLFRYWFGRRDDAWYGRLFRDARAKGLIAGEITPAYATLGEKVLRRLYNMNHNVKLIFVMRDPVDRVWSAVNNAAKKGAADASTVGAALERARESGASARSAYADTIQRLEAIFPKSQIRYCFFEDLRDRPEALTAELLAFLGVDPKPAVPIHLPQAVNVAAGSKAAPLAFATEMARDYLPMVERLCQRFQGPPQAWRTRYRQLLDAPGGMEPARATASGATSDVAS